MKTVESYIEIDKRLQQMSNGENHETMPHQNMVFITKHEKEKPGRMRIVQDTSFWFWYKDGLRKYMVGPIQDDNQPEDVKSNEFPFGLQCRDQKCTARGVIYVTDANLRAQKRTHAKDGNYYQPADYDIDQTYPQRSLFQCYSRVSVNGEHSCKAIKLNKKSEGITAVVRDHILAQQKLPDCLTEKDADGYYRYTPLEDIVEQMVEEEACEMVCDCKKIYNEIGKAYKLFYGKQFPIRIITVLTLRRL